MTHGTAGLQLACTLILLGMAIALIRVRASLGRVLLAVVVAGPLTLVAGVVVMVVSTPLRVLGISSAGVIQQLYGALVIGLLGYVTAHKLATWSFLMEDGEVHQRGTLLRDPPPPGQRSHAALHPDPVSGPADLSDPDTPITLAGIPVSPGEETKHFKLIGATGTGKSTGIREMLARALARGDRAIIADPDGGYLGRFHDPARGDVILNPFDPEARKWDLFGEILEERDIEHLTRSLIPDSGDSERIWSEYARTFVTELMQQAVRSGMRDDRALLRLVTTAPREELRDRLAGTTAGPFLEEGNERMFGSVRSVASAALQALKHTTLQQAAPFSVRQWVREGAARAAGGSGGVLFLPYQATEIAALRTVISAWMRLAIFEAMNRREGDQRLWLVIDELDALGAIDGLKDALARLRKYGGRCVLGFQSISQVSGTYGRAAAETIVENCGNTLILRCSASEQGGTAEFASRLIGQREMRVPQVSRTHFPGQWEPSITTSAHLRTDPAVLASEIEQLADLSGFLKLASRPEWHRVRLSPADEPPAQPRVRPRPRPSPVRRAPATPVQTSAPQSTADGSATARGRPQGAPVRKRRSRAPGRPGQTPAAQPSPPPRKDPTEDTGTADGAQDPEGP